MTQQERKYTLGEVNTRMGTMGEVRFDQVLLDVIGVKPGDFLVFTISPEGIVTITGERKPTSQPGAPKPMGAPLSDVTQQTLFDIAPQAKPTHRRRPQKRSRI